MWFLDIETRSKTPLNKGMTNYVRCPSTEILILALAQNDRPAITLSGKMAIKSACKNIWESEEKIVAHNPAFDFLILKNKSLLPGAELGDLYKRFIPSDLLSLWAGGPNQLGLASQYWESPSQKNRGI